MALGRRGRNERPRVEREGGEECGTGGTLSHFCLGAVETEGCGVSQPQSRALPYPALPACLGHPVRHLISPVILTYL